MFPTPYSAVITVALSIGWFVAPGGGVGRGGVSGGCQGSGVDVVGRGSEAPKKCGGGAQHQRGTTLFFI